MLATRLPAPLPALFRVIMDHLDAANAWETRHWRLHRNDSRWKVPTPLTTKNAEQRIAHRALGHAFGPLALCATLGYGPRTAAFRAIHRFFAHTLIARQMDDDAHDWEEDLKHGIINIVNADVLNAWIPAQTEGSLHPSDLPELRTFFWEMRAERICKRILWHCTQAERALAGSELIAHTEPLQRLLTPIRASAERALTERTKTLAFLRTYTVKK